MKMGPLGFENEIFVKQSQMCGHANDTLPYENHNFKYENETSRSENHIFGLEKYSVVDLLRFFDLWCI